MILIIRTGKLHPLKEIIHMSLIIEWNIFHDILKYVSVLDDFKLQPVLKACFNKWLNQSHTT